MIHTETPPETTLPRWQPEPEDPRTRTGAWAFAIAGHALLFTLYFPASSPPPPKPTVYATPVPLANVPRQSPPPPTKPPETKPQEATVRIPVPEPPTPAPPEPIERTTVPLQTTFELVPTDDLVNLPTEPPPEPPTEILRVTGDVRAPVPLDQPEPRYTELARRHRVEGLVILDATLDAEGRVTDVQVMRGLPMGLEQEAVTAVRRWRYSPATLHGVPVPVRITVTVTYRLQ